MCLDPNGHPWPSLELRHLVALRAVAKHRHFGRAAATLGFTQSALSQQIATLEARVGARLVERRRGAGVARLTPRGAILDRHAARILERVATARTAMGLLGVLLVGTACGAALGARPRLVLDQPAGILVQADGSLLVAERSNRDRLVRIEPATGRRTVFAAGLDDPFGIARARDGSVLVSNAGSIVAFDVGGRRLRKVADVEASPIAVGGGDDVFYANRFDELGRIAPDGQIRRYNVPLSIPHGLCLAPDGSLIIADTGNRRILALNTETGSFRTVARDMRTPLGLVAEPSGSILVLEYDAGRLVRVRRNGSRSTVARGFVKPYALARAPNGTVYVVQAGNLDRASGSIRRVTRDRKVHPVPWRG
jgi:Bacterial regulatory helix-turn-helix protein, lysR family/SMP-30/Gluconolactonase/LRE-like region